MNSSLVKYISQHKVDGSINTHASMISPKCKIQMNKSTWEKFWILYCNLLIKTPDMISGIVEKPQHFLPVLVDVDIKKLEAPEGESIENLYEDKHVIGTIEVYQSVLRNIVEDCTDEHLTCVVLEKPLYRIRKGNQIIIKNGFHLHFPFTFLSKIDQEVHLLPRVKESLTKLKLFDEFENKIDNLIDKSYTRVAWLLYGSRKQENLQPYRVTSVFNSETEQISLEEAFKNYKIYDDKEREVKFVKEIAYYLPRILSIIPGPRDISEIKGNISYPVQINKVETKYKEDFPVKSLEENLKLAESLLEIISDSRADEYMDWMNVGWALYNISNGSKEGYNLWVKFSKRCSQKFNESTCVYEWGKMIKKDMTIGTLKHFAKIDNYEAYNKLTMDLVKPHIQNSLNGSHNDIAKALWEIYGYEYICSSITYKTWYKFYNNIWNKIEEGIHLRSKISDEIVNQYEEMGKELISKLRHASDEGEKAMYNVRLKQVQKLMNNLKSAPYKNNVMRECMEVFYEHDFNKKLDSNSWLIAFQNGIYDLKTCHFREGRPSDHISMKMGCNYNENLTDRDSSILDVYEFLEKVFPDTSVREYFLDTSSDVFVGGNPNKLVLFWSGEGDNAKSVTQSIFEKMMGNYSVKLPTSLITGKRTQSSAACPELARAGNGVRWAVLQEPDQKDVINIGILKELSGNDSFFARGLYKEGSEITPMFKLILICNEPPKLPYNDKATWNRIRVIPFESTFCDNAPDSFEEQLLQKRFPKDTHFDSKIPGMLEAFAWILIEHRKHIVRRIEPEKVKLATAHYRLKNDIYRQFIEECIKEDPTSNISMVELYSQFKEWFKDSLPNHSVPIKNEVKEYFIKLWGETSLGYKWEGYRIRSLQDEINSGEIVVLEENDLVNYE